MPERRSAFYDFSVSPYSYDFLAFLVAARGQGCNHVVFVPGERAYQKCSPAEQAFRMEHLLIPLASLSGEVTVCKTREEAKQYEPSFPPGYTVDKPTHFHMLAQVIKLGRLKMIQPSERARQIVKDLGSPITITIRETHIKPGRNSNIPEWIKAAAKSIPNVLFVPDTENVERDFGFPSYPLAAFDVDVRLALYERASMNLGVGNGPMTLCTYGRHPYRMLNPLNDAFFESSSEYWKCIGVGKQFPWAKENQRIVWKPDTFAAITESLELETA